MTFERILEKTELRKFKIKIKDCFIKENFIPNKKHLEIYYNYVRLNDCFSFNNPQNVFYEILNEKELLSFFEIENFDEVFSRYGIFGKINFIEIKLLEME